MPNNPEYAAKMRQKLELCDEARLELVEFSALICRGLLKCLLDGSPRMARRPRRGRRRSSDSRRAAAAHQRGNPEAITEAATTPTRPRGTIACGGVRSLSRSSTLVKAGKPLVRNSARVARGSRLC